MKKRATTLQNINTWGSGEYDEVLPILFYQNIPEVLAVINERFIVPMEREN